MSISIFHILEAFRKLSFRMFWFLYDGNSTTRPIGLARWVFSKTDRVVNKTQSFGRALLSSTELFLLFGPPKNKVKKK